MATPKPKPKYTPRSKKTNAVYTAVWSQDGQPLSKSVVAQLEAAVESIVKDNGLLYTSGRD